MARSPNSIGRPSICSNHQQLGQGWERVCPQGTDQARRLFGEHIPASLSHWGSPAPANSPGLRTEAPFASISQGGKTTELSPTNQPQTIKPLHSMDAPLPWVAGTSVSTPLGGRASLPPRSKGATLHLHPDYLHLDSSFPLAHSLLQDCSWSRPPSSQSTFSPERPRRGGRTHDRPRAQARLQRSSQPEYSSGWTVRSRHSSATSPPALLQRLGLKGEGCLVTEELHFPAGNVTTVMPQKVGAMSRETGAVLQCLLGFVVWARSLTSIRKGA